MKKFKKVEKSTLDIDTILKVEELFKSKSWEIDDNENEMSRFHRFCCMLDKLNDKEKELILELSSRFIVVGFNDYLNKLQIALEKLYNNPELEVNEESVLYIMPLISPKDKGKTKSSNFMLYLLKSGALNYNNNLYPENFVYVEHNLPQGINSTKKNQFLVLVDDFIGTGETAEECLRPLFLKSIVKEKTVVLSLVAQESGIDKINNLGVKVISAIIVKKGITDFYEEEEAKNKKGIMKQIEDRIKIDSQYRLGYNESEGLVSMIRTPDNTFPIFWHENKKMMNIAPFPRGQT